MLQAFAIIGVSAAIILAPVALIDLSQVTEKTNNKEVYATITQMEDLKAYNNLYVDKHGISGTNNLLYHGVKPSELLVYDKDVTEYDGILLNHYDSALQSYIATNPTGTPDCTALADTKLITYNDCDYIINKKMQMMTLDGNNKVVFEMSENFGKKMTSIMNLSSTESVATTTTDTTNVASGSTTLDSNKTITTYKIGREQSEIDKNGANNQKLHKVVTNIQSNVNELIEKGYYLLASKELERISRGNVDNNMFSLTNSLLNKVTQQMTISETKQIAVVNNTDLTKFVTDYTNENLRLQSIGSNAIVDTKFDYVNFGGMIYNTYANPTFISVSVFGKLFEYHLTLNIDMNPSYVASLIVKLINQYGNGEIVASNNLNIVTVKKLTKATSTLIPKDCEALKVFDDYTIGVICDTSDTSFYMSKVRYNLAKVIISALVTNQKYKALLSPQAKYFIGQLTTTEKEDIKNKILDEKFGLSNESVKKVVSLELTNIINNIQQ